MKDQKSLQNISTDVDRQVGFNAFPYTSLLSFAPLIDFWKSKVCSKNVGEQLIAKSVVRELDSAMDLMSPIRDSKLLEKHRDFIELMMSGVFPFAQRNQQMAQVVRPFSLEGVYKTKRLKAFLKNNRLNIVNDKDPVQTRNDAIVRAGCMILNKYYGQQFPLKDPYIFSARSEDTLIETHYKAALNLDFLELKKTRGLPSLDEDEIFELINNFDRPQLWLEKIPPTHFEFHGMVSVQFVDVTEEVAISRIRQFLLEKDAVLEPQTIAKVEDLLSSYFNIPGLRLGFTGFKYPRETEMERYIDVRQHLLKDIYPNLKKAGFEGSIYEEVATGKKDRIFQHLDKRNNPTPLEIALLEEGVRSIYLAPLQRRSGTIFAFLELAAPEPYAINSFTKIKIAEIQPLFRTAISRKIDEINNAIGAIIRKNFTNIHPSVEWRFLQEASRLLKSEEPTDPQPIVFKNVFPLYGQADIVNSTINRNRAVQADMMDTFDQLLQVLRKAQKYLVDPMADRMILILEEMLIAHQGLISPDEDQQDLNLIKTEIYPFLEKIHLQHPQLKMAWLNFKNRLHPTMQIVTIRRQSYEQSVHLINETILNFFDQEEQNMQRVLPHYFERYQTDGVEYDIFLGGELLRKGNFEMQHLETFRLWQLRSLCELTKIINNLQPDLPHKLTTAQLILAYSLPLSIEFRMDEKKFDIAGEEDVNYAVLKKRIDKALIKGTANRLTLPGKVAVVYTQDKDREAYDRYFNYLINKKIIKPEVEDFELAPLQGVTGLRAVRVTVVV